MKLLQHRYPYLVGKEQLRQLWQYLSMEEPGQIEFLSKWKIDDEQMKEILPNEPHYPIDLGKDEKMESDTKTKIFLFLV